DDLEAARRLSSDGLKGRDVRSFYATHVEADPEAGLREAEPAAAARQPEALLSKASCLAALGRFSESNQIYRHLLELDPANQRLMRLWAIGLAAQRRTKDLMPLLGRLTRVPRQLEFAFTGHLADDGDSELAYVLRDGGPPVGDGERLVALLPVFDRMRYEHRYEQAQGVLDSFDVESIRVAPFHSALPGLGRRPV